jgi:prephenate dehydrogenase
MRVAIIGADGGMGKWLRRHLASLDFDVHGFYHESDDTAILSKADLVIISVPIGVTSKVIKSSLKHMRKGATLMEIASLKSNTYETMVEASTMGYNTLCVHPMFGPSTTDLLEKTVVLIPVMDVESEVKQTREIYPGASIEILGPDQHDKLMSVILSLPYLINLALARTLNDEDLIRLRKLSGTTFSLQYILTQSVTAENTSLISSLINDNRFLNDLAEKYVESLNDIMRLKDYTNFAILHNEIKDIMRRDPIHDKSHEIRQISYDSIRPLLR